MPRYKYESRADHRRLHIRAVEPVHDYLTRFSGLVPGDLDPALSKHHIVELKHAYLKLRYLVDAGCVFVGHGLKQDFKMINVTVPPAQIVDTVELFHFKRQRKLSLRFPRATCSRRTFSRRRTIPSRTRGRRCVCTTSTWRCRRRVTLRDNSWRFTASASNTGSRGEEARQRRRTPKPGDAATSTTTTTARPHRASASPRHRATTAPSTGPSTAPPSTASSEKERRARRFFTDAGGLSDWAAAEMERVLNSPLPTLGPMPPLGATPGPVPSPQPQNAAGMGMGTSAGIPAPIPPRGERRR